jgi:hypothetical protein
MCATIKRAILAGMIAIAAATAEADVVKQIDAVTGVTSYSYTQHPAGHNRSKYAIAPRRPETEALELPERPAVDAVLALGQDVAAAAVRATSIAAAMAVSAASRAGVAAAWVADKSAVVMARAASAGSVVATAASSWVTTTSSWVAAVSRRMTAPIPADEVRMAALTVPPAPPAPPVQRRRHASAELRPVTWAVTRAAINPAPTTTVAAARVPMPVVPVAAARAAMPAVTTTVASIEPIPTRSKASHRNTTRVSYSPPGFPRIDPATQQARDSERLEILKEELQSERMAMNDAIAKNAAGETVQRHEAVIAALQREISNMK